MSKQKYVYWKDDDTWLGYLDDSQTIGRKETLKTTSESIWLISTRT
jgi:hypothetical protein